MITFPMTACPMGADNTVPMVQDECTPNPASRLSMSHEATVLKMVGINAASSITLVDRTSGFWDGPAENTLNLTQAATVLPVRFGIATSSITFSQEVNGIGGRCPCGATVLTIATDTTLPTGNDLIVLVNAASGQVEVTLPPPTLMIGKMVHVKKIDSSGYAALVVTPGSETIDSLDEQRVEFQWNSMQITSDGTNWYIL